MNVPPTPKQRSKAPIESFGPELMATLLKGARERTEVPMPYRKGVALRRRLNSLRARMREENHPAYSLAMRAMIQLHWGKDAGLDPVPEHTNSQGVRFPDDIDVPAKLIISPRDSEFTTDLQRAGIQADLKEDPLSESHETPDSDPLSAFRTP